MMVWINDEGDNQGNATNIAYNNVNVYKITYNARWHKITDFYPF